MKLKAALVCAVSELTRQTLAARHEILVGDPNAEVNTTSALVFVPDLVNATSGDTVSFVFAALWSNHRVVQGILDLPCAMAAEGFDSGWRPIAGDASQNSTFSFVVHTSEPIFFFCAQPDAVSERAHCLDGMVGAISAAPESLAAFRASATALDELPSLPTSGVSKATPSTTLPSASANGEQRESHSKTAVGLTLALLGVFFLLLWCHCRQKDRMRKRVLSRPPLLPAPPQSESTRAWRLNISIVVSGTNSDPPSVVVRAPPAASVTVTRPRDTEGQDLPRYEDRRADVLLDQAAPVQVEVPATAQQEVPPPDYARSRVA